MSSGIAERVGPRYVSRFACIGAACEDDCCHGWRVPVDEPHYLELKKAMDGSPRERERFRDTHQRNREGDRSRARYAFTVLRDDGRCAMLDSDGLCATHKRYGAAVLSDTCATYPRTLSLVGRRLEVQAALSCPEAARLCLLAADALDPVALPAEAGARPALQQALPAAPAAPYRRVFDDVRGMTWRLLGAPHPLSSRLSFLALFGEQTKPFLHHDAGAPCEAPLAEVWAAFDGAALDRLHSDLTGDVPDSLAFALVVRLLRQRLTAPIASPFAKLVERALGGDGSDGAAALERYQARRRLWRERHGARINQYFLNYAGNYLLRSWYVDAPDLLAWSLGLLVRMAVVRFVLFMHPRLRDAVEHSTDTQRRELDAAVVETVYQFTRAVDHDAEFRASLDATLAAAGFTTAAHGALLARF